mmetsp:Transcript_18522/g.44687  ORF Transcript_18522/g.44687 Transcript_18522/m.44687 type:complete len:422 (+) Transcript_18522:224-1489(+)|eukprot:CAMPEP_0113522244 /NCGR_PEP_ID=MMETSP0014_2-20120614/45089_1 /TAXON_ID=2857 /ORGANISM="Nitzschia sp." /LENGTH=421 /DNA_ID=CAMNT_0000420295 /DNA_START=117 /DNA_END=1382 /DNA_ORIENTATION=- /assembly_acc=CAM_ASM_000159
MPNQLPPPATLGFTILMVVVFVSERAMSSMSATKPNNHLQLFTMCPRNVIYLHEYYRIVTSCIFHANTMHIVMNMMSFVVVGGKVLERRYGTLPMTFIVTFATVWTSIVYLVISYVLAYLVVGYDKWMYQHSVGFSGVLFHLAVLECNDPTSQQHQRSIFGIVQVPASVYPWVLLVVLQFIMPNLSFLGHLSGILSGTMQSYGLLDAWFFPSPSYWIELEQQCQEAAASSSSLSSPLLVLKKVLRKARNANGYVLATNTSWTTAAAASSASRDGSSRVLFQNSVCRYMRGAVEKIMVCIFGRGRSLNSNIRIWLRSMPSGRAQQRRNHHGSNDDGENSDDLESHRNSSSNSNNNFPASGGRRLGRDDGITATVGNSRPRRGEKYETNMTRAGRDEDDGRDLTDEEMKPLVASSITATSEIV